MSKELEIEEQAPEKELQLLVQWSSPWEEFCSAIGPALAQSPRPLAGEAQSGLFPIRNLALVCVAEFLILTVLSIFPAKLAQMRAKMPTTPAKYDVLYFSADELPRTEDNGGSSSGQMGRAGGLHAFHRTQAIRVARGEVLREKVLDAPKLDLPHSDAAVANLLAYKAQVPGPAPSEGLKSTRQIPSLSAAPIAPTQNNVQRDRLLTAPKLDAAVVAPAPNASQTDGLSLRLPGSQRVQVVPPPVSAPERANVKNPRLTLPAPSVVAPPPTQVTRDLSKTGPGYGPGALTPQIVPPTVQVNGQADHRMLSGLGNNAVVPPPVDVNGATASGHKLGEWNNGSPVGPAINAQNGSLDHSRIAGLNPNIVPPPPNVSSGNVSSNGRGARAQGLGGPMEVGSIAAPPASGGSGNSTGVVVSSQPGATPAVPTKTGSGSLALSPTGGAKPGIGGTGGGTGIDYGSGTGSGAANTGSGAAKLGTGHGSDVTAKSGISPYPGSGGAGSGTVNNPPLPGVSVHGGGSNIVTLPSFGTNGSAPSTPGHTTNSGHTGSGITVVATSRSGGAFNLYGTLKGDNYTIYLPTSLGTAVMQFADPNAPEHSAMMTSPQPVRTALPPNLQPSRLIISCVLDRTGLIQNLRVLEPASAELTAKVLAALPHWKFTPAMRGSQPVEVNVILGFAIDTR